MILGETYHRHYAASGRGWLKYQPLVEFTVLDEYNYAFRATAGPALWSDKPGEWAAAYRDGEPLAAKFVREEDCEYCR